MPIWLVKTTWLEDETEATEQWEVNADSEHAAVEEVAKHVQFPPHHIEARERPAAVCKKTTLSPGQVRRLSP